MFAQDVYGQSLTVIAERGDGFLSVVCNLPNNPIKGWAVARVTVENDMFVHESLGSYFTVQGAMKKHCCVLSIPCEYEETFDDFI